MAEKYGKQYFGWQSDQGAFGGWADIPKFSPYISPGDAVLDFGCGGGYLLANLDCRERIGVEINPAARTKAAENGVRVYEAAESLPGESVDVIISNHALEHVRCPLGELQELHRVLKPGGKIIFVIPCETIRMKYTPGDRNHHLYSWGPLTLGNLFTEAGFKVIESRPYLHKWPPLYRSIARLGGRVLFEILGRLYARIERTTFQVRVVAEK